MIIYPAIDLLDGRVVRLHLGDFTAATDYGDDPAAVAEGFVRGGAQWIHVVDLSGARDGQRRQTDALARLAAAGAPIQTGGGIRGEADVEAVLEAGASRVIIGSLAVTAPETVVEWTARFGAERLVVALDVRLENGVARPATKGWTEMSSTDLDTLLTRLAEGGVKHALITDIGRDGALQGPNIALYRRLATDFPDVDIQASGGVSSLDDLRALKAAGAAGAITGKAIYERRFRLEEAIACSQSA